MRVLHCLTLLTLFYAINYDAITSFQKSRIEKHLLFIKANYSSTPDYVHK